MLEETEEYKFKTPMVVKQQVEALEPMIPDQWYVPPKFDIRMSDLTFPAGYMLMTGIGVDNTAFFIRENINLGPFLTLKGKVKILALKIIHSLL
jgi:hypothetical protein